MGKTREEPKTPFGRYLRALMDAQGYTSDAMLARATNDDVTASMLSKWQNSPIKPTIASLRIIAPLLKVRIGDLLVKGELATAEELGMAGAPLQAPEPMHPLNARLQRFFADPDVSDAAKALVERQVEGILGMAAAMTPLPTEPSAAERAAGKTVTHKR